MLKTQSVALNWSKVYSTSYKTKTKIVRLFVRRKMEMLESECSAQITHTVVFNLYKFASCGNGIRKTKLGRNESNVILISNVARNIHILLNAFVP